MRERNMTIAIRATPATKAALRELAEAMSQNLGTKISQTQAVEMAIREALVSRGR